MSNRPEFVDNIEGNTLAKAIREYIEYLDEQLAEPPKLCIASGYFNPRGYFSIADALDKVKDIRILLGAEPKEKDRERWQKPGEPKGEEYNVQLVGEALQTLDEHIQRDRNLLGFSREIDKDLQEMIDFLNDESVEVRRYEDDFLHGKAFMFLDEQGVIAGSSNFTGGGLNSNLELNLGHYSPHVTEQVQDWFEKLWENSKDYDLASVYEERFEPYDPYLIYLRTLWERYHEEIEAEKEERTGGEIKLTNFQNDGVFRAKRFLNERNGVIIADEVGLGKTFIAGKLIEETVQEKRQNALVIAPGYLLDGMWKKKRSNWNIYFDAITFSKLRDEKQLGGERSYLQQNKDDYQLVVIDEGHAFRNPGTDQAQALRNLLRGDPPKNLVLATATPVNNSLWDLYYLLSYFIKNDAEFSSEGITSLRERFKSVQSRDPSDLSPDLLFDILDKTSVRRTRRFVKKYYPNEKIPTPDGGEIRIKFPDPKPQRLDYNFNEAFDKEFFNDVASGLAAESESGSNPQEDSKLTLARYRPSKYRPEEKDGSELALVGLLRTGLLKRFESSRQAFANTLDKMINQNQAALELLDKGVFPEPEAIDEWAEADSDEAFEEAFAEGERIELDSINFDEESFRDDLETDIEILNRWKGDAKSVSIEDDGKLRALREELVDIKNRAKEDAENEDEFRRNRKVLIFTYFEDTVDWILDYFEEIVSRDDRLSCYRNRIAGVAGGGGKPNVSRKQAVQGFAPESTEAPAGTEDKFDILVTTDVLGQGVNLQQCRNVINYDLPWNPMRVVQRNGRIDRINSPHPKIYTYTFFPEDRLDDLLELEFRVRRKLTQAAKSIGLENEVIPDSETAYQNFADKREKIESLRAEKSEVLEEGGGAAPAFSSEEYRQELRKGMKERGDEIESLPWGAGSGFEGENPGYFFCARVGDEVFLRFISLDKNEIFDDTLTCLRSIECSQDTERELSEEMREGVYKAWGQAQEDIYKQWQEQTDPKNVQPDIRPLFRKIADHLREYPPEQVNQDDLEEVIESVEAPYGRRHERELRDIYKKDLDPEEKSNKLIDKIEELGLQPYKAPEPLNPIEKEEVKLVCWLAIAPKDEHLYL